jgi:hypothetical protein
MGRGPAPGGQHDLAVGGPRLTGRPTTRDPERMSLGLLSWLASCPEDPVAKQVITASGWRIGTFGQIRHSRLCASSNLVDVRMIMTAQFRVLGGVG